MVKILVSQSSRQWANELNDLRERWQIRREEVVNYEVPIYHLREDLSKLDRKALIKIKENLHEFMRDLRLELAKINAKNRGVGAQSVVLMGALTSFRNHLGEVEYQLGSRKKEERDKSMAEFRTILLNVIEEGIGKEKFKQFVNKAHAIYRGTDHE